MRIPKVRPIVHPRIWLWGGTDRVVHIESESLVADGSVHFGQLNPQLVLRSSSTKLQVLKKNKGLVIVLTKTDRRRYLNSMRI